MMTLERNLIAVHVARDDVGDYHVTEAGWYAADDGEKVVLGPFASLDECDRAIQDRHGSAPERGTRSSPGITSAT